MKPCVRCHRHVRRDAAACPFCAAALLDAPAPNTRNAWTLGLVMLAACGGKDSGSEDSGSGTSSTSDGPGQSSTSDPGTTTTGTPTTSAGESSTGGTTDGCGTACDESSEAGGFIYGSPDAGQAVDECSLEAEDCPAGQKCMPVADDGNLWNRLKCMPVDPAAVGVGEVCDAPGDGLDGLDNCEKHAMCFNVKSNTGVCVQMCDDGACPAEFGCLNANNGVLQLCLPSCDVMNPDCPPEENCIPVASGGVCAP